MSLCPIAYWMYSCGIDWPATLRTKITMQVTLLSIVICPPVQHWHLITRVSLPHADNLPARLCAGATFVLLFCFFVVVFFTQRTESQSNSVIPYVCWKNKKSTVVSAFVTVYMQSTYHSEYVPLTGYIGLHVREKFWDTIKIWYSLKYLCEIFLWMKTHTDVRITNTLTVVLVF